MVITIATNRTKSDHNNRSPLLYMCDFGKEDFQLLTIFGRLLSTVSTKMPILTSCLLTLVPI